MKAPCLGKSQKTGGCGEFVGELHVHPATCTFIRLPDNCRCHLVSRRAKRVSAPDGHGQIAEGGLSLALSGPEMAAGLYPGILPAMSLQPQS